MTTGYGRGSSFLPRPKVGKHKSTAADAADKFYAQLYPGGKYPGWWVGPEYAEPAKVKVRK